MIKKLNEWNGEFETIVSVGTFDGVHLGHKKLLKKMRKVAVRAGLSSLIFTFSQPPKKYLTHDTKLITLPEEKFKLLASEGDHLVIADFTDIRKLSPEDFANQILKKKLKMKGLVVGANFKFGKNREGKVETLTNLSKKYGFELKVVTPREKKGKPISSSQVREAIRNGDVEEARLFLGYYPQVYGTVVPGEMRGRKLGFPTINLKVDKRLVIPRQGIFAAFTHPSEGTCEASLMYIGNRPTFGGKLKSFEVHLLNKDLANSMCGEKIRVTLLKKMREDRKFPNLESLKTQMEKDVQNAKNFFRSVLSTST